jgi:hypothetical protein
MLSLRVSYQSAWQNSSVQSIDCMNWKAWPGPPVGLSGIELTSTAGDQDVPFDDVRTMTRLPWLRQAFVTGSLGRSE